MNIAMKMRAVAKQPAWAMQDDQARTVCGIHCVLSADGFIPLPAAREVTQACATSG